MKRQIILFAVLALAVGAALPIAAQVSAPGFSLAKTLVCIRTAVGADRFTAMSAGQAEATADEVAKAGECFGIQPPAPPVTAGLPDALKTCLIKAVGQARFEAVMNGEPPTAADQKRGKPCFEQFAKQSPKDRPLDTPGRIRKPLDNLPPGKAACVKETLGEDRFKAVFDDLQGGLTLDEKQALAEKCFNNERGDDEAGSAGNTEKDQGRQFNMQPPIGRALPGGPPAPPAFAGASAGRPANPATQPFKQPPLPPAPPVQPIQLNGVPQSPNSDDCIAKIVGPATLQQLKASNYDFTAAGVSEDQSKQIISRCFGGRE